MQTYFARHLTRTCQSIQTALCPTHFTDQHFSTLIVVCVLLVKLSLPSATCERRIRRQLTFRFASQVVVQDQNTLWSYRTRSLLPLPQLLPAARAYLTPPCACSLRLQGQKTSACNPALPGPLPCCSILPTPPCACSLRLQGQKTSPCHPALPGTFPCC